MLLLHLHLPPALLLLLHLPGLRHCCCFCLHCSAAAAIPPCLDPIIYRAFMDCLSASSVAQLPLLLLLQCMLPLQLLLLKLSCTEDTPASMETYTAAVTDLWSLLLLLLLPAHAALKSTASMESPLLPSVAETLLLL
jgi:hypothetical protein